MIQLIIILLFMVIKLAMHCEENASTTKGETTWVLYEVDSRFNGKVKFAW